MQAFGFLKKYSTDVASLLDTINEGVCISSQVNNICETLWSVAKYLEVPNTWRNSETRGFFPPPAASLNKEKVGLSCNSLLYIWRKKTNTTNSAYELEDEISFYVLLFNIHTEISLFAKCAHYFFQ